MMTNTLEDIGRVKLQELLDQCTPEQVNKFNIMYGSVRAVELHQLNWAIQQVERTIKQNLENENE
jgi:hypothetical protein